MTALFIADFYPQLGAYLARQYADGYVADVGRARFQAWLTAHADDDETVADHPVRAGRIPRLTAEEEVELATRIRAGRRAEEASAGLLAANQWLVVSLAERYTGRGVPLGDLVRQGNVGLNLAVQRYDPAKGYRFATFATWWVRQAIMRTVAGQRRGDDGLTRTERQVLEILGREPTPEELAAELD